MTNPTSGKSTDPHADHDLELVAAHAAGDLDGPGALQVEGLLARCPTCADLVSDLRSIAAATKRLPARRRPAGLDFRLTPADAARLSRGGLWRRVLRPFGTRASVARPLSLAFTTIGVAGLLLATLPLMSGLGFASGGAAPQAAVSQNSGAANGGEDTATDRAAFSSSGPKAVATSAPVASAPAAGDVTAASAAPTAPQFAAASLGPSSLGPSNVANAAPTPQEAPAGDDGPSPLLVLSVGFLAAGIGLFVLRRLATRLR